MIDYPDDKENDDDLKDIDNEDNESPLPVLPVDNDLVAYQAQQAAQSASVPQTSAPASTGTPSIPDSSTPPTNSIPINAELLHNAQEAGNKQRMYASLLRGFQQALEGSAAGSGFKADTGAADTLEKNASLPEEQVKTQLAQEKSDALTAVKLKQVNAQTEKILQDSQKRKLTDDPKSEISKFAQNLVIQTQNELGQPADEANIRAQSGTSLYQIYPYLQKRLVDMHKEQQFNQLLEQKEEQRKSTEDYQNKHLSQQERMLQEQIAGRKDIAASNAEAKESVGNEKVVDKLTKDMTEALDPNKARGGNLAKSQAMVNAAERVNGLFKQFPDGNIPSQQTSELAGAVAGLINGGSAQSQHQINTLTPSSMRGDASKIASWITNEPLGSEQQSFMKMLQETSTREKGIGEDQVKKAQIQRLPGFEKLKKLDPDGYNRILQGAYLDPAMIDEKGQYIKPGATGPLGDTTVKNGKTYKWNASVGKYQLLGQPGQ